MHKARDKVYRRLILILVFGFLYLPIAVLVLLSFNASGLPTAWSGFSTKWYVSLAGNSDILHAAWNTLVVAVFATLISTVLGTMLALGMVLIAIMIGLLLLQARASARFSGEKQETANG